MRPSDPSAATSIACFRRFFVVIDIQFHVSESSQMIPYPQKLRFFSDSREHFLPRGAQEFHPLLPHKIV
jgi:hypothetical protein